MSSGEEEHDVENSLTSPQDSKRRRINRACDKCRRKKVRCDGPQVLDNRCSNCVVHGHDCTYVEAARKRGPPKSYIEGLETRVERLQQLISQISPEALEMLDISPDVIPDSRPSLPDVPMITFVTPEPKKESRGIVPSFIRHVGVTLPEMESSFGEDEFLLDNLENLSLGSNGNRFFGKSSGAVLIKTVLEFKRDAMGADSDQSVPRIRPLRAWKVPTSNRVDYPRYTFPEEELMRSLIDLYFANMNLYLPLLHRPTFERSIAEGLHRSDDAFAVVLLLVCAVGSRFSPDPRVLLDKDGSPQSSGWKWFSQVPMVKKTPLEPTSLYELQFYPLLGQFFQASSVPQACWNVVGVGIRIAQDVGAHRRKGHLNNTEDELWKRTFWVLVCMDRLFSSSLGRPCSIHDEDFDLDLPVECDDEYWEHTDPQQCFKQPLNKPSVVVYFNSYIRLNQILAFLLRTVYAINKSKILFGFVGQQWEEHIVSELDSALNRWVDALPDHLRWDPNRQDKIFFNQSASLYCAYYHIQILIHGPFIPSPRKPSSLSFPSLAICTNAARACSHVLDTQHKRYRFAPAPLQTAAFSAGVVLLLSIWGGKRSGLSTDTNKEMVDVKKCMDVLKTAEPRWYIAGRLWDILYELASAGDLPLPKSASSTHKCEREESESPAPSGPMPIITDPHPIQVMSDTSRSIIGSRRSENPASSGSISRTPLPPQAQSSQVPIMPPETVLTQTQHVYTPPVYSEQILQPHLHHQRSFHTQPRHPEPKHVNAQYWYGSAPTGGTSEAHSSGANSQTSQPSTAEKQYGYASVDINDMSSMSPFVSEGNPYPRFLRNEQYTQPSTTAVAQPGHYLHGHSATTRSVHTSAAHAQTSPPEPHTLDATYSMWSDVPASFELDEWGTYLSNISDTAHAQHGTPHGASGGQYPQGGRRI